MNSPSKLRLSLLVQLLAFAVIANGCLSIDRKEIIFTVKPDGSGSARIIFHDIVSVEEQAQDGSVRDYTELIQKYVKGTKFEEYYPLYSNFKKRLFEENGTLSGELTYDFSNYEDVGLYRYQGTGPWMYHVGYRSEFVVERFDTSNGTLGGELMPVIFWSDSTKEFHVVSHFDRSDLAVRQLLPLYKRIGTE